MEGTRLRILQLLQKNHADTVDGLARAIGLAPATIRRHLDILQRDRLVAFDEVRKKTGRPEYSFFLTEGGQEALPKSYNRLLGMIVGELSALKPKDTRGKDGQQLLELLFQRLSANVSQGYSESLSGKGLADKVDALVKRLGEGDFFPETDVVDGKLRIRLLNCPFRSVALRNEAVCTFDYNLIGSVLGMSVTRETSIHNGDNGCTYCIPLDDEAQRELAPLARS